MWLDSPPMQPGAVITPQQDPNDLQYWLSWDLMTDGPDFSTASSSSLDGTNSNVSSLGNSLDNSVQTTPSTLFGDVMDSPKIDFSNLNTNANSLFPPSSSYNGDSFFDYGEFYRDQSRHSKAPVQGRTAFTSQDQITSISPQALQAPQPTAPQPGPQPQPQPMSRSDSLSDSGGSEYAASRRSSTASASPPPRSKPMKKKRSSMDASNPSSSQASKKCKRPGSVVDKKYRDKLKDKMAELKRTVPTVRAALDGEDGENADGVAGLMPASNSRKPTILTKAIEYIHYLEDKNESLSAQLAHIRPPTAG